MALVESASRLTETLMRLRLSEAETPIELVEMMDAMNNALLKYVKEPETPVKRGIKEYSCLKCGEKNPEMFNRKKSECTPCISKAGYVKIKVKLDQGKERNVAARLSRVECMHCKLKVTQENALMFDWDHRNPSEKTYTVSRMNYKTDELFNAEIEKCDLVCKNCHILRTMRQHAANEIPKRKSKMSTNVAPNI
jgi:hypothetical protein